jgi:hypothetical protein
VKTFVAILLFTLSNLCWSQTYVQINGVSLHDRPGYNGFNYGMGFEQAVAEKISVAAGWYHNSEYRGSTYAYARYSVYKNNHWDLGLAAGAVTGYKRMPVLPMAFPEACYKWSCVMIVPKVEQNGANVVAIRLRIPLNQ